MSEQNHYIEMMLKSLQKKIEALQIILDECKEQAKIIEQREINWEQFDACVDHKQQQIDGLAKLDEGFSDLYERVKSELQDNRDQYRLEIKKMQAMIKQITDMSVHIQAEEERNRKAVEGGMLQTKQTIKASKACIKAASDYYKVMSKVNYVDPQFVDKKK